MQDQEGFDDSDKLQIVEFSYQPLLVRSQIKRKPTIKAQENWQVMRQASRGEWAQSLVMNEPQNVIFSSCTDEILVPETHFQFEADFESSNLQLVIRRRFLEYQLYMRPDTNTDTHFQWFYFKVKCCKGAKTATFTIKNFLKAGMLYHSGLRPFYRKNASGNYQQLSTQAHFSENIPQDTHCLKFTFDFEADEQVEFSSQPPYTYSRMTNLLRNNNLESKILCKSPMGRKVPYLVFNEQKSPKGIVIVIARQHPGESVGSWMMEGLLKKLIIQKSAIKWVVVPMMCVDGVILGNNRTGLQGYDFNRYWNMDQVNRRQKYFPEIVGVINLIKLMKRQHPRKPKLFLDLHGHSSQPNIFTYGPPHEPNNQNYILSRAFPELLALKNPNFSLEQCSYMIKPDKRNTVRGLMYNYYLLPFVYTIEASFGRMRGVSVNQDAYLAFGQDLFAISEEFMTKYFQSQKAAEVITVIQSIRLRGQQNDAVQYDSDSQVDKSLEKKKLSISDRGRQRTITETNTSTTSHRKQSGLNSINLLKVVQECRYMKPLQRKRTQTEVSMVKQCKANFLPRLKQSGIQLAKHSPKEQELKGGVVMNIKQIQKKLSKLKNTRIGKKILILSSYAGG